MWLPNGRGTVVVAMLVAPILSRAAAAQTPTPVQRADLTAAVGSFTSRHAEGSEFDRWGTTAVGTFTGGYYWTDHLKTEIEVGWTGEREVYGSAPPPPGVPAFYRVYQTHRFRSTVTSATQLWQSGRNAFVHPYIGVGLAADREREEIDRPPQSLPTTTTPNPPLRLVPAFTSTTSRVVVRPFTVFGFKAYFSPRGFFRTDLRLGLDRGIDQVVWRAGFGVDF